MVPESGSGPGVLVLHAYVLEPSPRRLALDDRRLTLRIDIDHWLYRLFAPHMDIAYDVRSRRLLWYEGPTHILDALRAVRTVRIDYRYGSEAAAAGAIPDHHAAVGSTTSIAIGR